MRSMIRSLTVAGLVLGSATALMAQGGGQPPAAPRRPGPPAAGARPSLEERERAVRERELELRERALDRREGLQGRQLGRGPAFQGRGGMGPGMGPGMRQGMGRGIGAGPGGRGFRRGAAMGAGPGFGRGMGFGPAGRRAMRDGAIRRRAVAGERMRNLTNEQVTALRRFQDEATAFRRSVGDKVRAGTLNREQARAEMQKWRADHKPPVDLRRPPEGQER